MLSEQDVSNAYFAYRMNAYAKKYNTTPEQQVEKFWFVCDVPVDDDERNYVYSCFENGKTILMDKLIILGDVTTNPFQTPTIGSDIAPVIFIVNGYIMYLTSYIEVTLSPCRRSAFVE